MAVKRLNIGQSIIFIMFEQINTSPNMSLRLHQPVKLDCMCEIGEGVDLSEWSTDLTSCIDHVKIR